MLNMLVTCEHWRSLTPTHVEGKVGGGGGGGSCRPQETPGCQRVLEPRMTAAGGSRKVP